MRNKRMKNKNTFIRCSDKETIEELEKLGYRKVSYSNGVAVFMNDLSKPQTFNKSKIAYSNILLMA